MDPQIVQRIVAPAFVLMGLSHLVQPRLWVRFFEILRKTDVAAMIIPIYTLPLGLVMVVGHNLWVWDWSVLLTLSGWIMVIKSALYLVAPRLADLMLDRHIVKSARTFQIAGAVMMMLGAIIAWQAWAR